MGGARSRVRVEGELYLLGGLGRFREAEGGEHRLVRWWGVVHLSWWQLHHDAFLVCSFLIRAWFFSVPIFRRNAVARFAFGIAERFAAHSQRRRCMSCL